MEIRVRKGTALGGQRHSQRKSTTEFSKSIISNMPDFATLEITLCLRRK